MSQTSVLNHKYLLVEEKFDVNLDQLLSEAALLRS